MIFNIIVDSEVLQRFSRKRDLETVHHGICCKLGDKGLTIYANDGKYMGHTVCGYEIVSGGWCKCLILWGFKTMWLQ